MNGIICEAPKFNSERGNDCLGCHANFLLLDIPHIIVGHFLPEKDCNGATEKIRE